MEQVKVLEIQIRPGQRVCPTDPLIIVGEDAEEQEEWPVTCPYPGTITRVFAKVGDRLSETAALCEIDTDLKPEQRLSSFATRSTIMGRSTALVEDVLAIVELTKLQPSHVLSRTERQILQEWANLTDWFFEAYGDRIGQFAKGLLHRRGSAQTRQNADDFAQEVLLKVRDEWERGVLLRAYIKNCDKNHGEDVSSQFRTYLMGRIRFRIRDVIRSGSVAESLIEEPDNAIASESLADDGDESSLWEILNEPPLAAFQRWCNRFSLPVGDRDRRRLKYWISAETRVLKLDISSKVERYPDDLRDERQPRSIEREWSRKFLDPIILVGYDELKNGTPTLPQLSPSDDFLSRAIALALVGVDIIVTPDYVLRVIQRSRGQVGDAD